MTAQDTIFKSDQDDSSKQTSQNTNDTSSNLATLVGDARKYKTPDDLAKAYIHLDEFSEQLKAENAKLREQVAQSKTVEDVLNRLNAEDRQNTQDQGGKKTDRGSSLSATDVATIVREQLTGLETARSRQANLMKADAAMREAFGDKAAEMFQKEAATPEMKKALMELASVSPEKFVALFHKGAAAPSGQQVDSKTVVNTAAMDNVSQAGRDADPGCKEYYTKLRKEKPTLYYSHAIQLQMAKAAENRAKFYPGS